MSLDTVLWFWNIILFVFEIPSILNAANGVPISKVSSFNARAIGGKESTALSRLYIMFLLNLMIPRLFCVLYPAVKAVWVLSATVHTVETIYFFVTVFLGKKEERPKLAIVEYFMVVIIALNAVLFSYQAFVL
eukprot:PhF_6_TR42420/c0_g1_i2/m.63981